MQSQNSQQLLSITFWSIKNHSVIASHCHTTFFPGVDFVKGRTRTTTTLPNW